MQAETGYFRIYGMPANLVVGMSPELRALLVRRRRAAAVALLT
jgi:hypothetical protein